MRKSVVAGNWKMNGTLKEAKELVGQLKLSCQVDAVEVLVCPPFTSLAMVSELLKGSSIGLGAQNLFWETAGAFTGEISPAMLMDVGCRYAIIGHSERRQHFGETDDSVQRKLSRAIAYEITPIVCIGETLEDRGSGKTFEVLTRQLSGAFAKCEGWDCSRIILAYEPVWAIGTGRNAQPEQVQEAHAFIRQWISKRCGEETGANMRLQYGGSVNAENAASLLNQPDVDGALVGGASLKADAFTVIVRAAAEAKSAREQQGC